MVEETLRLAYLEIFDYYEYKYNYSYVRVVDLGVVKADDSLKTTDHLKLREFCSRVRRRYKRDGREKSRYEERFRLSNKIWTTWSWCP